MQGLLKQLITDLGSFRAEVNKRFDGVDQRFDRVEQRLDGVEQRLDGVEQRLDKQEALVAESHQWIRAMLERQDVQKAANDNLGMRDATIEGSLKGMAGSLEPLKEAK